MLREQPGLNDDQLSAEEHADVQANCCVSTPVEPPNSQDSLRSGIRLSKMIRNSPLCVADPTLYELFLDVRSEGHVSYSCVTRATAQPVRST
jgi:hypothetical protein